MLTLNVWYDNDNCERLTHMNTRAHTHIHSHTQAHILPTSECLPQAKKRNSYRDQINYKCENILGLVCRAISVNLLFHSNALCLLSKMLLSISNNFKMLVFPTITLSQLCARISKKRWAVFKPNHSYCSCYHNILKPQVWAMDMYGMVFHVYWLRFLCLDEKILHCQTSQNDKKMLAKYDFLCFKVS